MDGYEAASTVRGLVVSVRGNGTCMEVRLSPGAMELSADELASRIVRLNTLACLRQRADLGEKAQCGRADGTDVPGFAPSAAQVAAYAQTIDF
jgi:hypothetical protein